MKTPRIAFTPFIATIAAAFALSTTAHSQDISHRKADLVVQVQSGAGSPLTGAAVEVEMLNHAIRFGCAVEYDYINPSSNSYDEFTVTQLQKYFNSTTYGNFMKWSYYESRTDQQNQAIAALPQTFNAFDGPDKLRLRGHVTVWGAWYQLPNRVRASEDGPYISEQILEHVEAYHTTFKDSGIDNYDLYNEHFNQRQYIIEKIVPSGDIAEEAAEVAKWFNKAKEADPNAILFINEFNILNDWSASDDQVKAYKAFIDAIRDAGGQIDGIGLQAHMDHANIPKADIVRRLDLLAAPMAPTENYPDGLPGLRIEITELDMAIKNEIHNADWVPWTNATMQEQVTLTESVITAAFEHPSVDGITIWGLDDLTHWRGNAIMYDNLAEGSSESNRIPQDPVLKATGQLWIDYVTGEWWEDHSGFTTPDGQYSANTFRGTHRVTVTFNGVAQSEIVTLQEDDSITFHFEAEAADAADYDSWTTFIEWGEASSGRADDPDTDGRSNLDEFVFGTDPLAFDLPKPPQLVLAEGAADLIRYTVRARSEGLDIELLVSTDLETWEVMPFQLTGVTISEGLAGHTITFDDSNLEPSSQQGSIFYRFRISEAQ